MIDEVYDGYVSYLENHGFQIDSTGGNSCNVSLGGNLLAALILNSADFTVNLTP